MNEAFSVTINPRMCSTILQFFFHIQLPNARHLQKSMFEIVCSVNFMRSFDKN